MGIAMVDEGQSRSRLGRGLAALIGDASEEALLADRVRGARRVPIEFLRPNPQNPRSHFDHEGLEELASSIRERGVLQPIMVRPVPNLSDAFEIIAGERRWRAAQRAGLHDVPVQVIEADDRQSLEYAIIENVQRSDLNALEEALGYERLSANFDHSQADIARIVGKSRSHVANTLRLLNLPDSVKEKLHEGLLTAGHARALLSVPNPEAVAQEIVERGLTVRDVERLSQLAAPETKQAPFKTRSEKAADTRALEKALSDVIGLAVSINHKEKGGVVTIKYGTLEQLDAICQKLQA
jgi:ParB family chromosome partitioning protein